MEIIVGKTAGFCFGIEKAVSKAETVAEKSKSIYCLGELAHNKQVIEDLARKRNNFYRRYKRSRRKADYKSTWSTKTDI
jgi:4-hydroxy-3-methylbut-2-enyl diphosphate reductase IspH